MFKGDRSRKSTLAEYGFRLPSCMDNRPLKFEEWDMMRTQTVFVSATPGPWELEQTKGKFIDQVIRPTGLIDPNVEIRPAKNQVDDLMHECKKVVEKNFRGRLSMQDGSLKPYSDKVFFLVWSPLYIPFNCGTVT